MGPGCSWARSTPRWSWRRTRRMRIAAEAAGAAWMPARPTPSPHLTGWMRPGAASGGGGAAGRSRPGGGGGGRLGGGGAGVSSLVKRSFSLAGHRTSVALEPEFWAVLAKLADEGGETLAGLVARLDGGRAP